jgi:hypothetical protein
MLVSVILERNKPEGLKHAARSGAQRIQHFGHAIDIARTGLKFNFHEIAFGDRDRQLQ